MSEQMPHLGDEIQEYLDGRLDPERQAQVRAHLAECDICRAELRRFEWLKTTLRQSMIEAPVPADLEQSIRAALAGRPWWQARWLMAAGVAALLALIVGGGLWWWHQPPTPSEIADDYVAYSRDLLSMDYVTQDTQALTRYFAEHGIRFRTRVWDLGMMQYTLVGGRVQPHRGLESALFVYRNDQDEHVICQMYVASPPAAVPVDRRTHNGVEFTVYRRGNVTLVFWQEEDGVTCVLASSGDAEALIQLAFAKAERRS